jgi:hypothetical protein
MPKKREAELPGSARRCLLLSYLCHCRVTKGTDSGEAGCLKLKGTGVEKLS